LSGKAICGEIVFNITGNRSAAHIFNKYSTGTLKGDVLILEPLEVIFLFWKRRIRAENPVFNDGALLLKTMLHEDEIPLWNTYRDLRIAGYRVKRNGMELKARERSSASTIFTVKTVRENFRFQFSQLFQWKDNIIAAVDDDGGVTFYKIAEIEIEGSLDIPEFPEKPVLMEKRSVYSGSTLPEWIGDSTTVNFTVLSELETRYINGEKPEGLVELVYRDLFRKRSIIRTGFKYGCNFRIYLNELSSHAEALVHVFDKDEGWYAISRAVRVAGGVKKKMIFAGLYNETIKYVEIKRMKSFVNDEIEEDESDL
jgi:tRNA-intron endonuclease